MFTIETAVKATVAPPAAAEPRSGLLRPGIQRLKRVFDVLLALLLGLIALPFAVAVSLAIVLETPGPVFFHHDRIGRGGRRFRLWKFRSMVADADQFFEEYLEQHPEQRREWVSSRKLKHDPRVTRVGRFLRRTSLDELPQVWNVLSGDMSMIGPRPIVAEEIAKYGQAFGLYAKVRPGLTGLWQVSGRNDTSYRTRTAIDSAYIRNWSPQLDVSVLLRTVLVVIRGRAY